MVFFLNSNGFFWSSFCFSSWVLLATLLTRMCPCTVLDVYLLSLVSSQVCHTSEGFTIKWRKADEYPRRALESDRQDLPPPPPHLTPEQRLCLEKERKREKGGKKRKARPHPLLPPLLLRFQLGSFSLRGSRRTLKSEVRSSSVCVCVCGGPFEVNFFIFNPWLACLSHLDLKNLLFNYFFIFARDVLLRLLESVRL